MKFLINLILLSIYTYATGGYDNGSAVGKNRLELDITLNPLDIVPYGQSYLTWNYGISEKSSIHGYLSHEAKDGSSQIYYGFKYTFLGNSLWDIATAVGLRNRHSNYYLYFPQLLYTYKLAYQYDIGGSVVGVYNIQKSHYRGITYDIALRIPFKLPWISNYIENTKLAIGIFRNASNRIYPTYSIDFKF